MKKEEEKKKKRPTVSQDTWRRHRVKALWGKVQVVRLTGVVQVPSIVEF